MQKVKTCASLSEVREEIDRIDRVLVALLAERGAYVRQAAGHKRSAAEVPAAQRIEQIIAKVKARAQEVGAEPGVVEATWRAMIAAFIDVELRAWQVRELTGGS
jgi:isochorismate pyruvate lyase